MREIKFRGKSLINIGSVKINDLVYGGIVYDTDRVWIDTPYLGQICVDENTVGQFTGLKDKNGVEIYEGDIVKITRENQNKYLRTNFKAIIEWSDRYLAYILNTEKVNEAFEDLGDYLDDYELEVIR